MMNMKLTAPPADANVEVTLRWAKGDKESLGHIPGATYHVDISGLPEASYYALRVSDNAGSFSDLNATTQQTTVGCAGQLIALKASTLRATPAQHGPSFIGLC